MNLKSSYLKHQFAILKNPAGYTPESVEKAADYIWKQLETLNDANAELSESIVKLLQRTRDLELEVETLKAKIAKKKAPKKAV